MRRVLLAGAMVSAAAFAAADGTLRELNTHLTFLNSCASKGSYEAGAACAALLAPEKIKICFAESATPRERAPLRQALSTWETSLGGATKFEIVPKGEASVVVHLVERLEIEGKALGGYTFWKRSVEHDSDGYSPNLQATVYLARGFGRRQFSHEAMAQAALHEMGHVLGLDDGQSGVMSAVDPDHPITKPAAGEIKALMDLRQKVNAALALARLRDSRQLK